MEDRKEYLKIEKFMEEIVKEIARVLEGYGFRLVEWKKEGNALVLIAQMGESKMELRFSLED